MNMGRKTFTIAYANVCQPAASLSVPAQVKIMPVVAVNDTGLSADLTLL